MRRLLPLLTLLLAACGQSGDLYLPDRNAPKAEAAAPAPLPAPVPASPAAATQDEPQTPPQPTTP